MCRLEVVGYRPVLDEVIDELQRVGAVQVESAPEHLPTEALEAGSSRRRLIEEYAADARFVRDFLHRFHKPTHLFATFITEKVHMSHDEFDRLEVGADLLEIYRACEVLADSIAHAEREHAQLADLVHDLEPWLGVRLQIAQWKGTEHTVLTSGTVPAGDGPRIRQALRDVTPLMSVAEFGGAGLREAWIVLAHTSCADLVRSALAATSFVEVSFPDLEDYPAEESARAAARILELEARLSELTERAEALALEHYAEAVAIVESNDSDAAAVAVRERIGRTERVFVVNGWVRATKADEVLCALDPWSGDLDIEFREPADDESPPVELDNPKLLRPFEVLTDLYGRPGYRELDPTPLLAPFFLLFFAICISDVGYGAMLALGAWLIKKRLDVADTVKRFCDLMIIGGVGSMVVGVAFRSYFAMDVTWLPPFLRYEPVLDPLQDLQTFLLVTIALGVAQVFFGVAVSAYDSFRRGDAATAVFEQLSTIFLFVMIVAAALAFTTGNATLGSWALVIGIVGTMLMQGRALEAALGDPDAPMRDRAVGWSWLGAVVASMALMATQSVWTGIGVLVGSSVLALASRTGRKAVVALLGGAYAVYGMTSFLGDILSYTRLAALGLTSVLVGMVFNILAGLVWGPVAGLAGNASWWGWPAAAAVAVAAAAVFAFGHVFNVVINLLGAFVHPARLQFIEFFSKFYQGSGRPLAPFRLVTRSVVLHAGAVRQEGGVGS